MLKILIFGFIGFFILFNVIPKYPYIFVHIAQKKIKEGKHKEGLEVFKKACRFKNISPFTRVRYAFLELKYGELKLSKQMIMYVLSERKMPMNIKYEAKAIYSLILYKEGELEEAKEELLEVYENYKTTNIYCTLGYLFNVLEEPELAIKFNEEAYDYNDNHNVILDNLGQSYYLNNNIEKANEIYEKLMEKNPNFPEAYYNFALVLIKKEQYLKAYEMASKALTLEFNALSTVTKEEASELLSELENKKQKYLSNND